MKPDPERLLDTPVDDFERALLDAANADVGSRAAQARCIAAATGVLVAAHAATASAAAPLTVQAAKWLIVGAALGLGVSGAAVAIFPSSPASSGPHVLAAPRARPVSKTVVSRPRERAHPESDRPEVSPATDVRREPPATIAATPTPGSEPRPTTVASSNLGLPALEASAIDRGTLLEKEVLLLDSARRALVQGNPLLARAELDRHDRDFPNGVLAPEALLVRVQTLLALGQRSSAQALAQRFLATHPTGPHARRLEEILASPNP
jgi:hypothetical protein